MAPVWNFDPIAFVIPGVDLPVRYYGIIFGLVLVVGFLFFRWQVVRAGRHEDEAYAFILPGALGVILGARIGHVLFYNFDKFQHDPAWLIRVWDGGLASHGATIGLILALGYYAHRWKRPFWDTCDRFSFSAAFGASLVRLGNFFNSEIVGKVTDGPLGVRFPRFDRLPAEFTPARYPSQLVEFGLGLLILGFLLWLDRRLGREKRPQGALAAAFLILYFSGRFLVEFIKERHGAVDDFILSRGQLLSLPGIILGGLVLAWVLKSHKPAHASGRGGQGG